MIEIRLVAIASLADDMGTRFISVNTQQGVSARDIIIEGCAQSNVDAKMIIDQIQLVAFEHNRIDLDDPIMRSGELAMMPPITGG